jgi:hypothetical protein
MTYLVAHFSALGVSNFVNTCVRVCVCFFFHLSFDSPLVNSDFQSCGFS